MRSILDKDFRYVPSVATDLKKKFEEIRIEARIKFDEEKKRSEVLAAAAEKQTAAIAAEAAGVVAKTRIGRST